MLKTIEEATHEFEVALEEAAADNPDMEIDPADMIAAVSWSIENDDVARELCRTQLGFVPHDLVGRLDPVSKSKTL